MLPHAKVKAKYIGKTWMICGGNFPIPKHPCAHAIFSTAYMRIQELKMATAEVVVETEAGIDDERAEPDQIEENEDNNINSTSTKKKKKKKKKKKGIFLFVDEPAS